MPAAFFIAAIACAAVLLVAPPSTFAAAQDICPEDLASYVNEVVSNNSKLLAGSLLGITVQVLNASSWQTLYAANELQYSSPASNTKLLTTAAAFRALGPDHVFTTQLLGSGDGLLCVTGGGDPSLAWTDLQSLAAAAAQQQRRQTVPFTSLIIDTSIYIGDVTPDTWEWGDLWADYGAVPSALIVNENTFSISISPAAMPGQPAEWSFVGDDSLQQALLAVPVQVNVTTEEKNSSCSIDARYYLGDPALYISGCINRDAAPSVQVAAAIKCYDFTASLLSAALNQAGVLISSIRSGNCGSANWLWNIKHTSLPLSNLMNHTLQESDNLYAEAWLQSLAVLRSPPVETAFSSQYLATPTRDAALETARALLMQMGVDGDLFHQKDGSGLSRWNLVAPAAIAAVLRNMSNEPLYISMLPVAGVSGTLADRFVNTSAQGIVHAKTGTMTGVNSLSGYMLHDAFPPTIFSIISNFSSQSSSVIRSIIDAIVLLLPRLRAC